MICNYRVDCPEVLIRTWIARSSPLVRNRSRAACYTSRRGVALSARSIYGFFFFFYNDRRTWRNHNKYYCWNRFFFFFRERNLHGEKLWNKKRLARLTRPYYYCYCYFFTGSFLSCLPTDTLLRSYCSMSRLPIRTFEIPKLANRSWFWFWRVIRREPNTQSFYYTRSSF